MTETQASRRFAKTALKWRDLIDRRCAHFIELHKSGRWKHYYDEGQFLALMREAVELADAWARMAPRPEDEREVQAALAALSRLRKAA